MSTHITEQPQRRKLGSPNVDCASTPPGPMHFPRLKTSPATERDVGWWTQTDFIMWVLKLIQLFGAEALTFYRLKGWIKCIDSINIYWPFSRCQALGQVPKTDRVLQPQSFHGASRGDDQVEGEQWGYISVFHKCAGECTVVSHWNTNFIHFMSWDASV